MKSEIFIKCLYNSVGFLLIFSISFVIASDVQTIKKPQKNKEATISLQFSDKYKHVAPDLA